MDRRVAGSLKTAVIWMTAVGKELGGGQSLSEGPAQTGNPHSQWVLVRLLRKTAYKQTVLDPRVAEVSGRSVGLGSRRLCDSCCCEDCSGICSGLESE